MFDSKGWGPDGWDDPSMQVKPRNLSPADKVERARFVNEYFKDFDWVNAAIRNGCESLMEAQEIAQEYKYDTYVLNLIEDRKAKMQLDSDKFIQAAKRHVINTLLQQASGNVPGSTQNGTIAAATQLSKLLGMEPDKNTNVNVQHSGVMAVPGIASIEDWEQAATDCQEKLVQDTQEEHDE